MAHTTHGGTSEEQARYFQGLWEHLLDPDRTLDDRLEGLLESETDAFGMEYGFLSRIDLEADEQTLEAVHSTNGTFDSTMTIPLPQTYCRQTIASEEGTMAISDAPAEGWEDDPAYERFGLDSYVGTTVTVDGELYGTLCFASSASRSEPFSAAERALLEMHGRWLSYELSQRDRHDGPWADRSDDRLDALTAALGDHTRRRLLLELLEDTTADPVDLLDAESDRQTARVRLRHVHLPKLEQAGYVEWDRETTTVSRGENFDEVAPLVRLWTEPPRLVADSPDE